MNVVNPDGSISIDGLVAVLRDTTPYWWWVEISQEAKDGCLRAAAARDAQKQGFASSRYWNPKAHYLGLLGEWVFAHVTGQAVNYELLLEGDGGTDFAGVNVKTATFVAEPHLKQSPSEHWPEIFALVVLEGEERGRYAGYATADEMRAAPLREYAAGYGEKHYLLESQLHQQLPPGFELGRSS